MTPRRVSRTGIDRTTPDPSSSVISALARCISTTTPSGFIWNGSIGNMRQTNTPISGIPVK